MTRSIILATLAAAAIAAVATVVPRFSGRTEQVEATDGASLALDMDITNGSGPCNPIDSERGSSSDEPEYKVAICLTGSAVPPAAFEFDLIYDDMLDQCVPVDCPDTDCLDGNPDANVGATVFSSPDLGTDWDCSNMHLSPPVCDKDPGTGPDHGKAFITCMSVKTPTLPVGPGVSAPIAVVAFKNIAKGRDTFTLGTAALYDYDVANIVKCPGAQCLGGARDELLSPPATPTPGGVPPTATPGATDTPGAAGTPGVGSTPGATGPGATSAAATAVALGTPLSALTPPPAGTTTPGAKKTPSASPTARPSATPGEENKEGEGGGTNAGVIAGIVIGAVVVVGGIGWFAWRRLRLR
jgi:hypothetical protein